MGFFKDLRKVQKASKEISADFDPAAQMRAASAQMQQVTKQAQLTTTGVQAPATITAIRNTQTEVNLQPVVAVDVTVFPAGGPPFPSTMSVVGHAALGGLVVGANVDVRYDPSDTSTAALATTLGA